MVIKYILRRKDSPFSFLFFSFLSHRRSFPFANNKISLSFSEGIRGSRDKTRTKKYLSPEKTKSLSSSALDKISSSFVTRSVLTIPYFSAKVHFNYTHHLTGLNFHWISNLFIFPFFSAALPFLVLGMEKTVAFESSAC